MLSFCVVSFGHSMIHCKQKSKGKTVMEKRKPRQLYSKLFWTYTVIVLTIVSALTVYFITVSGKNVMESNMEELERINTSCADYIDEMSERADYFYKDLYRSRSKLDDLLAYMELDPEAYQRYYLDRYAETGDLVYEGILDFLTEAFEACGELEKVEIVSYKDFKMTECRPEKIVYPGRDGKTRLEKLQNGEQEQDGRLIYIKQVNRTDNMENVGCMIFTFEGEEAFQKIQNTGKITQTVVVSEYGQPVFEDILPEKWEIMLNREKYYQERTMADRYTIYSFQGREEAGHISAGTFFMIIGAGAAAVILGIVLIEYYVRRLTMRVSGILEAMDQVTTGDLRVRLHVEHSKDELDLIARNFNHMCEELELYIQKSYLAEIERKNAQLQALQSQINPHFLYNTLEAIRMKAICNGDREVGKMLYSMVGLFRSQLKEADMITLGQELDYCKQYLELFMFRFKGIFAYYLECEPELLPLPIIKFVLQPIVENYFIHGIDRERTDNRVHIRAQRKEDKLCLYIEDNGFGMKQEEIDKKNQELKDNLPEKEKKQSIGIANVNRRIKAVYGEEYGIVMEAAETGGLRVIVTVRTETERES